MNQLESSEFMLKIPEGRVYGPITYDSLQQWVIEGRIDEECALRVSGTAEWISPSSLFPILTLPVELAAGYPFHRTVRPEQKAKYFRPHHAPSILLLAIIGLFGACPIFGIMAWWFANDELVQIESNTIDPSGKPSLLWSYFMGMASTLIYGLTFLGLLLVGLMRMLL